MYALVYVLDFSFSSSAGLGTLLVYVREYVLGFSFSSSFEVVFPRLEYVRVYVGVLEVEVETGGARDARYVPDVDE